MGLYAYRARPSKDKWYVERRETQEAYLWGAILIGICSFGILLPIFLKIWDDMRGEWERDPWTKEYFDTPEAALAAARENDRSWNTKYED